MIKKSREALEFGLFVAPALICILLMSEIPFLMGIYYAFTRWNGISASPRFIGLENFREFFSDDPTAFQAILFTFKFTFLFAGCLNLVALIVAILLNENLKSKNVLRTLFFLPFVMSLLITAYMWKFIFTVGLTNLFQLTGWEVFNLGWLSEKNLALLSVAIVSVWRFIGYHMAIYIAGLQSIPGDLLEAAKIDGAGRLQRLVKITLPLLMPAITVSVFLSIVVGLNVFDIPYALTNGGPAGRTTGISMDIYNEAFLRNRYGYATAKSIVFFILAATIAFLQVAISKKREVEL